MINIGDSKPFVNVAQNVGLVEILTCSLICPLANLPPSRPEAPLREGWASTEALY